MLELAKTIIASGEAIWHPATNQLAPQTEQTIDKYLDQAQSRACAVLPLAFKPDAPQGEMQSRTTSPQIVGALICDEFHGSFDEGFAQRADALADHAATALHNALEYHSLYLLPVWRALGKMSWLVKARTLPKTVAALLCIAALVAAAVFIQADFEVEGRGRLQPALRRVVYARMDGVVDRLHVKHGQMVHQGDLLAELRNTSHEYQRATVLGELQTTQKRLASAQATVLTTDRDTAANRARYSQLAAEIEQLTTEQRSLQQRFDLLTQQQSDLKVVSPIEGQVLTWDVSELLEDRPVTHGQALLTVADTTGPWVLEILLPDKRIGYVRASRQELKPDLDVSFILATDPGHARVGKIKDVALSAEIDEELGSTVLITVAIDHEQVAELRPGATVIAKIDCGRRSLGYVWLHEFIAFVQSRILFRL